MPDPVTRGIEAMLDHVRELEKQQAELRALAERLEKQIEATSVAADRPTGTG
jgi:uncharacterized coiled-coil protein SlyX